MGNFVGARGSSFSHRGLWIAKNSVTIEFIYKKLQRNEGCSRRLIALRIYTARYRSIPLAPGTNLIAGFVGYRPLTHWQKKKWNRLSWARSIQPKFPGQADRSNREKWSTSKDGPVFLKLFRLDRTDPFSFRPKFPEILVEWIAPLISFDNNFQSHE